MNRLLAWTLASLVLGGGACSGDGGAATSDAEDLSEDTGQPDADAADADVEDGSGDADSGEIDTDDADATPDAAADADTGSTDTEADTEPDFEDFPPGPPRLYHVDGTSLRDRDGNVLHLRGMNVANEAKWTDDHLVDLDEDQLATLRGSAIDMARLLTFWDAIMPEEGVVDEAYVAAYAERVRQLTDAGVLVVVDMHQDLWGAPMAGHGAPAWACPEEVTAGYAPIEPWWGNYPSRQVAGCFDIFWDSDELRGAFADAWTAVAEAVCDEGGVLGFDLINEPYPGLAHMSRTFDNDVLVRFYDELMRSIELACPGRLFFVEPSFVSSFRFTEAMTFPPHWRDRAVYSGHFYPAYVHEPSGAGYSGDADALEDLFDELFGRQIDAGYPIWVGEFGGMTQHEAFGAYVTDLEDYWARIGVHHAYWDWTGSNGGFGFRTLDGVRKTVFDAVYGTPFPVRTPSPATLLPSFSEHVMDITFTCHEGGTVEVGLPDPTCSCDPDEPLTPQETGPHRFAAVCGGEGELTLRCSCP